MNNNQDLQITYRKIINIAWLITIVVSLIILVISFIFNRGNVIYWPLSYLLGAMTNFFAFNLLKNNVANLTGDTKGGISGSFSNYAVRFLIYAGVLFISFKNLNLNEYIVASGFITIRIAIYIYTFINRKN